MNHFSFNNFFAIFIFSKFPCFSITKFLSQNCIFKLLFTFSEKVKAKTGKFGLYAEAVFATNQVFVKTIIAFAHISSAV
jgi:hypothetical protein